MTVGSSLKFLIVAILLSASMLGESIQRVSQAGDLTSIVFEEWERGVALYPASMPEMKMYLWFYEWTLFDAIAPGEHTGASYDHPRRVTRDRAVINTPQLTLRVQAVGDGAELELSVTNRSQHDWGALAGIIPCFNPGPEQRRNPSMIDPEHCRTFFRGERSLEPLKEREIHFNHELRPLLKRLSPRLEFVFSKKWPTSDRDAYAGFLVRESADGRWSAAITWQDFVSVQGHNPWKCMHHSVRVGPLPRGSSKTVRGKIYLLLGTKEDAWHRYIRDF